MASFFFILTSCSYFQKTEKEESFLRSKENSRKWQEGIAQLHFLGKELIRSPKQKISKIEGKAEEYLLKNFNQMKKGLPSFFTEKSSVPTFYIIKGEAPLLFSLKGGFFFFSSGVLKKYLNNEELFLAAYAAEIIREHHGIYLNKKIVPVGEIELERLLAMLRLPENERVKIWKWAYFVLKRAEKDGTAVLNWIQLQNKNSLEFIHMLGGKYNLSKEEFLFKNFLSKQKGFSFDQVVKEKDSREFYSFLKAVP